MINIIYFLQVRKTVLEVEYPLIEGQLAEIDQGLEQAEKSLNWENEGNAFERYLDKKERDNMLYFKKCNIEHHKAV